MTAKLIVTCHAVLLSGCCWLSKRECFAPCPACPPAAVVKVEVPCKLPPKVLIETVKRQTMGCPEKMVCYDTPNAAILAKNVSALRAWILEVRARCENAVDSGIPLRLTPDAGMGPRAPGDLGGER